MQIPNIIHSEGGINDESETNIRRNPHE